MDSFLANLKSPAWWLSVIVVGLIVGVVAIYFKEALDRTWGHLSSRQRARNEQARVERARRVSELRADRHLQIMEGFRELRCRLAFLVWGAITFGLAISTVFFSGAVRVFYVALAAMALLFTLGNMQTADEIKQLNASALTKEGPG